ncbi:hypothetical protein MmarC5_0914 [Methanococcus maripaludis C5]|uniref:Uncharacterized protein n=1 Tax=Methanococcus maripaludis (strain C5 / ATCC BAA-1333) TaxID=402880 RepID=A4FYD6_METM5|nr:hypothetical protein [Methanococcus maripaludis]ABO35220.1 hypothetical protein MmarC5_0914 [Methanococcus maripaludis C5]
MKKCLKSLKLMGFILSFLITTSPIASFVKFNLIYQFFSYFEYSTENVLYNYLWNTVFNPSLDDMLKLGLIILLYLSFLGYLQSKKVFFEDSSKMSNYFNILNLIYSILGITTLFLSIYLILENIYLFLVFAITYVIGLFFLDALKQYSRCFHDYQKSNEYLELINKLNRNKKNLMNMDDGPNFWDNFKNYSIITTTYGFMRAFQVYVIILSFLTIYAGLFFKINLIAILFVFLTIIYWFICLCMISYKFRNKSDIYLINGEIL